MPRLAVSELPIYPAYDRTIATYDDLFSVKLRVRISLEPPTPKGDYIRSSFDPPTVRRRRRVLKNRIVRQKLR
jgi:hypothetical protein